MASSLLDWFENIIAQMYILYATCQISPFKFYNCNNNNNKMDLIFWDLFESNSTSARDSATNIYWNTLEFTNGIKYRLCNCVDWAAATEPHITYWNSPISLMYSKSEITMRRATRVILILKSHPTVSVLCKSVAATVSIVFDLIDNASRCQAIQRIS